MHGSVYEWCQDYWHENYNGAPVDGSAWEESPTDDRRMFRGGGWNRHAWYCRSTNRSRNYPHTHLLNLGLRVVRNVDPSIVRGVESWALYR